MTKDRGEHTAVKLLIVINQFYKGGAETNLLNLLKALPETDDPVDLLVYDQMKLPNVISLLPQVPPHVTVCDAAGREDGNGFWHKALCRITRDATKKQLYRPACFEFVKDKHYDAAISYGEWISPEFVAEYVQADRKIVWIHSDIDKALFFNEEVMFRFDDKIDLYLFASGKSMETALARYPIMQGRATVVHNLCDDESIRRAAMAPQIPTKTGREAVLIDCGATADCTPEFLLQFAFMGSYYAEKVLGIENPRVALLNIGAEDSKGGELQKAVYPLLKQAGEAGAINFTGNIEARDVPLGGADVVVADGFSGNILLKGIEGTALFMASMMKDMFKKNVLTKLAALLCMDGVKAFKKKMDYRETGGTALIGLSKPVIKAHGSSDALAIRNAIRQAIGAVEADVAATLAANMDHMVIPKEYQYAE